MLFVTIVSENALSMTSSRRTLISKVGTCNMQSIQSPINFSKLLSGYLDELAPRLEFVKEFIQTSSYYS